MPSLFHSTTSVLDVLLSESRLLSGLTDLGLTLSDIQSVIQTPVHSQVQSFAVDMRSESVVVSHMTYHVTFGRILDYSHVVC